LNLAYGTLNESPIGTVSFAAGDHGLQRVAFTSLDSLKSTINTANTYPSLNGFLTINALLLENNDYFQGLLKSFTIPIDWGNFGEFQRKVLAVTMAIPFGEVLTYGEVAEKLGNRGAARAVGRALGANPMPIVIPCHRVISSDRDLRGYTGGLERKAFLLQLEGHPIVDQQRRLF